MNCFNMAEAMFTEMVDLATVTPTITKEIHVHGNTLEESCIILEKLVYLKDVEVMVFVIYCSCQSWKSLSRACYYQRRN